MASFTNRATLSYNNVIKNSNIVTGELREVLSMTKTAVTSTYSPGDRVTYVISIVNSGTTAYTAMTLNDNLGAYVSGAATFIPLSYIDGSVRYYQNGVLQAQPTVTAGNTLTIQNISIPASGNVTLVYETEVGTTAPPNVGGQIVNTATLTGGAMAAPLTASETIAAGSRPDLTISKSICPSTVVENGQLTYTFVIQNSGNAAATDSDGIVVTDTFDPKLNDISVTLNGNALSAGVGYTYDQTTGAFSTTEGVISVPAATFTQDAVSGAYTISPGVSILVVSGTV